MPVELRVPTVGESITEVQIGEWLKGEGAAAQKDDNLVEIESDKATVSISAPVNGRVTKVLKQTGETAAVGEVIGYMEEGVVAAGAPAAGAPSDGAPSANGGAGGTVVMPAARRELAENQLRSDQVTPTGPGGRLLKEDVQRHMAAGGAAGGAAAPPASVPAPVATPPVPAKPVVQPLMAGSVGREEEIVPMSPIRRRIAQRLVEAQHTAALLTTFNEIDMSGVMALRQEYRESFQQRYGVKLGFMSFFVKAAIDALRAFPQINTELRGTDIVYHNYFDIGIAVSGAKGLVVPILRNAERLSFAEIEQGIEDFGKRARENRIDLKELDGGTFTISNGGIFGSLLSTPIVNPPQSAILGLHAIQERPVAREGQVVIRPMMYVALTYDHRVVDGREAVTFLRRIKEGMEQPARLLLEV